MSALNITLDESTSSAVVSQSCPLLNAALQYAAIGWPIFPCVAGGKDPAIIGGNGFKNATTDEAIIRQWWARYPNSNIGFYPHGAGLSVLDVDVKNGSDGYTQLEALEAKHGELPHTQRQDTPSGGGHLFFFTDKPMPNNKIAPDIDIRCANGYVLLAPSIADGRAYEWIDGWSPDVAVPDLDFAEMPQWVIDVQQERIAAGAKANSDGEGLEYIEPNEDQKADIMNRLAEFLQRSQKSKHRYDGGTSGLGDTSGSAMDFSMCVLLKIGGFNYSETRFILEPWQHGSNNPKRDGERYWVRLWTRSADPAGSSVQIIEMLDALDDSDLPSEAPAQDDERNPSKFASIISKTKIGQYATQLADERQMPRDTTVLTALGVVSAAVSMIYSVGYRYASQIPTSLYIATEQPASTGKSGVLDAFTVPIQRAIRDMNRDAAKHNAELAEDDDTPRLPQYRAFVTDATPESLDGLLPRQHGHFCLASAEQGLVNTALGLNYGGGERKSNNDLILKGATGDWHSSLRVTRAGFEGNVFGSVAVIAQRGTIDTILEQSNATGLAERFIMLAEPTLLGYRDHLSKRACADYDLKIDYENATQALIKQYDNARRIGSVEYDWLERLELSGRDWDKIDKIKQQLEPTMADGGKNSHELLRGVVGKFDQRVMKLAAVLHVVESVMAGEKASNIIGSHYVDMAIDLANLSIEQLHTAMIDKGLIGMSAEEEVIYRIISNKGGHGILWNELYNATKGVQPFKSYPSKGMAASIRAVCQAMVTKGLLSAGEVLHGGKSALKLFAQ